MPKQAARPDRPGDQPIIDLEHLATFTDGDPGLESELAALYVSSAQAYLEQMEDALRKRDGWTRPAHALKGASSNLGALRVAALARAAETYPPDESQLNALRAAIRDVRDLFAARRA